MHLELILCFYSFVYAQFFEMSEVLETRDYVSDSPKVSQYLGDTDYSFYKMVFLAQLALTIVSNDVNDSVWWVLYNITYGWNILGDDVSFLHILSFIWFV